MIIGISGKKQHGKDTTANYIRRFTSSDWQIKKFADKLKDMVCLLLGCTREELEDSTFKESPLGTEWDVFRFNSTYTSETLDSEGYEVYEENQIFATREEAVVFGNHMKSTLHVPDEKKSYGQSGDYLFEIRKESLTPRLILQLLGTECGRQIIHPNIWVNALFADYKQIINEYPSTYNSPPHKYNEGYPDWIITDVRFPNEAYAVKDAGGLLIRINRSGMDISDTHPSETSLDNRSDWDYVISNDGTLDDLKHKVSNMIVNLNIDKCIMS